MLLHVCLRMVSFRDKVWVTFVYFAGINPRLIPFYVIRIARMCNGWHIMRGRFCHSLTHSAVSRCVTAGYAVRAPLEFSSKSLGFPRAKHHIGFIFSCENLTDIGQISLCWKCLPQDILNQKWEHIYAMCAGKITRLKLVVTKCFVRLQARFSSRQEGPITR